MRLSFFISMILVSSIGNSSLTAKDWTGWLGPNRDGQVSDFQPPKSWPKSLKKVWTQEVGAGYGSPIVSNGRAYQHARQGEEEVVWCVDLKTGKVQWRKSDDAPFKIAGGGEYHGKGPKSCPVLAKNKLITLSITGLMTTWDAETGKQLWQLDTGAQYKKKHPRWGVSTSPIIDEDRVIAHIGTDGHGTLMALDISSGKKVWTHGEDGPSYSSPLLVELEGVKQVIDWNEKALIGVESKTGKLLWEYPYPQKLTDQNMPTPVFHKGMILLGAENRGIRGLSPVLQNGKWTVREKWYQKGVALNMSTAIINDDLLYGLSHYGRGRIFCLDPKSGQVLWQGAERTGQHATFLSISGYVLVLIDTGELRILKATGKAYQQVASYRVSESATWAPPVLLSEGLLVKDKNSLTLWALGN